MIFILYLKSEDVEFKPTKRDHHLAKEHVSPRKEEAHSLHSVSGQKIGLLHKVYHTVFSMSFFASVTFTCDLHKSFFLEKELI